MTESSDCKHVIEHEFAVDRLAVWRAWVEPDEFARWYGPNVETEIHGFDVRSGGRCLIEMKVGDRSMYQRLDVMEVVFGERLVFLLSTTDSIWQDASMPMMPTWPVTFLMSLDLSDSSDGGSVLRLTSEPHGASAREIACFTENAGSMEAGWRSGFDLLESSATGDM